MVRVRASIRAQEKLALVYRDEAERETRRVVWPIAVSYWESVRIIVGWCELRQAFRHFRTDRIVAAEFLVQRYPTPRPRLRAAWKKQLGEPSQRGTGRVDAGVRLDALVE